MIRLPLPSAIASLLGKKEHTAYRDIGITVKAKDLYKMLGLTNSPMLYKYMEIEDLTIAPERALVFLDKFDILISDWVSEEELRNDCTNKERGKEIAYQPIKEIMENLVELDSYEDDTALRRGLKKLIAKHY